jgi:hypothetical protein
MPNKDIYDIGTIVHDPYRNVFGWAIKYKVEITKSEL